MESLTMIFTLLIVLSLTFPFIVVRTAIYCLCFYLKRKHSIILSVSKSGFITFRTIVLKIPSRCDDSSLEHEGKKYLLTITIDSLKLSSLYWDRSCTSILSICINNIVAQTLVGNGKYLPIKIGSIELPMDRITSDFIRHYKENFNISANDIVVVLGAFSYKIEKMNVIRSMKTQTILQFEFDRVIFSDLSIPEVQLFSEMPEELTKQRILFIEQLQVVYSTGHNKNLNATVNGDCFLQWNLEFHLNIVSLVNCMKIFASAFKTPKRQPLSTDPENKSNQVTNVTLNLEGRLSVGALVTENQTVCINTHSLEINASFPGPKTIESKLICLHFDEHTILACSMATVSHYPSPGESCKLDREQNSCGIKLSDKINSLLSVEIETVDLMFPYRYDFATVYNEKFMGIVKWLKKYHAKPIKKKADAGPISFDMSFRINKFSMEIEDDSFETKLRNNYMLLVDEYHEQLKREQTLQDRINEVKRTNLMLASSAVDELNKAMAKKNSDIYIQRSKQLYSSGSKQVPLFSVIIEEADLKILADSSFHKHQDIKALIKTLDPEGQISDDIKFSTLWCRVISANLKSAQVSLRDFPLPLISLKDLTVKGMILGTEQVAVVRARRECSIYMGKNCEPSTVERSMTPMKFFHNLQLRCTTANYTHGPCWEPILQQVSLSFDNIVSAGTDPSPSLPWWDKMRFIFHGQIKLNCDKLSVILHASNDPYNQTEMIELSLSRSSIGWTTGKIKIKGNFDVLLHTASKYDECRFVHIPNFDVTTTLDWNCLGNPFDHHSIMPCAPDKVPDYSSHLSHDSYRSFRSQSLDLSLIIETQYTSPISSMNPDNVPSMLFFGSTIRWLENQKFLFVGPSKLTRRGKLFANTKPRKPSLSRIFKDVKINVSLNRFQILYWSSVSRRHGIQLTGGELTHSSFHSLKLVSTSADGLKHRPQSDWQTINMNSSLVNVEIWLYNLGSEDLDEFNEFNTRTNLKNRQYFISFNRISYNKEAPAKKGVDLDDYDMMQTTDDVASEIETNDSDKLVPNHRLVVHDLKAAWTKENRDVVMSIFDAFINSQQLKRNLSTEALKPIRIETPMQISIPQAMAGNSPSYHRHQRHPSTTSLIVMNALNQVSSVSKNRAVSMLQKLIADSENNPNVYTEESHSGVSSETHLYGVEACQMDDVVDINCLIELVNSQVLLCGTETPGYMIVSAANTEIRKATHVPVWKNQTLLSKTSWTGNLRCMQYYATVDGQSQENNGRRIFSNEYDIQWLDPDNINSRNVIYDYPDLVGSGHSVGGVVSPVVGKKCDSDNDSTDQSPVQLQRIISRCNCLFYYAAHTAGVPDNLEHLIPPFPDDDLFIEPWDKEVGVDSFTLTHQDLDISTNSQQYAMIMDIINNLLLFVEPHKKTAFEKLERMRFRLQLSSDDDQREPISQLQDQVRKFVAYLKCLERQRYLVYRASIDDSLMPESDHNYRQSLDTLSEEILNVKEKLNAASEELAMMISCYKEVQLGAHKAQKQQAASQQGAGALFANVINRNEICFKSARWRVTDSDGQLGLADIVLNNFLYIKVIKSDDSVEHTIELGHLHVSNLIPNQAYKDVLHPTELQANIPLDRQRALRIYCRELAPVAGIPVKEHLEVNVIPFTVEVTLQFYQKMVKFFFPERETTKSKPATIMSTTSSRRSATYDEDIEKMRERASKNHTFVHIKIPGIPIKVSYKGRKSVTDLKNISLTLPTYEYHNSTWTWLDLLMAVKNDSKHTVIKQALRQKMKIRPSSIWSKNSQSPTASFEEKVPVTDEDKARILLGQYANLSKNSSNTY